MTYKLNEYVNSLMCQVFYRHFNVVSDTKNLDGVWTLLGGLRASSSLKQILTVSQGKCLQSMMQVYLYCICCPW